MKEAQQWHDEGVTNIASTLHRVDVKEIRAIQIDALREVREIVSRHPFGDEWTGKKTPSPALLELDKLIRELELR